MSKKSKHVVNVPAKRGCSRCELLAHACPEHHIGYLEGTVRRLNRKVLALRRELAAPMSNELTAADAAKEMGISEEEVRQGIRLCQFTGGKIRHGHYFLSKYSVEYFKRWGYGSHPSRPERVRRRVLKKIRKEIAAVDALEAA